MTPDDLIQRVRAHVPSANDGSLDHEVGLALGLERHPRDDTKWLRVQAALSDRLSAVGAALALVEARLPGKTVEMLVYGNNCRAVVYLPEDSFECERNDRHLALAIVEATLRALLASLENPDAQ